MRAKVRFALGVAVALYPAGCETTIRAPASGGSAGTLGEGATGGDSTASAGAPPAAAGSAATLGAAGEDEQPAAAGSTGQAAGGSSSVPGQGGSDDAAPRGGGESSRSGSGNVSQGGAAGTGARGGAGGAGAVAGTASAGGEGGEGDIFAVPSRCTSGLFRDPNESEGPEMNPGYACNQCHARLNAESGEGDAPIFAFAGTAFPTAHEPNSCVASDAQSAEVIVTDAEGVEFSAVANAVGNFFLDEGSPVFPITARIVVDGRTRKMTKPVPYGDCNLCHTQDGTRVLADREAPPGRVVLP